MTSSVKNAIRATVGRNYGGWIEVTPGERVKVRVTSGQTGGTFSVVELIADPGNGVPMHVHTGEDEHFVVLEGTLDFAIGDERSNVAAGSSFTVARGVPHAWCNSSDAPVHVLAIFSPAGIEALFGEMAELSDIASITAAAARYGTQLVGPPMLETSHSIDSRRE